MTRATASALAAARRDASGLRRLGPALGSLLERLADQNVMAAGAPRRYRAITGGPLPSLLTQTAKPEDDR